MRPVAIALLLAVSAPLAQAQTQVDTRAKRAEPALDASFLGPRLDGSLRPPTSGMSEPQQSVRTIRILPDNASAPEPPRQFYAQLTTQRTSQEAQDRFDEIQQRFPGALGNRQSVIMRTDAGLSTVYRAMVGPFDLVGANEMCDRLRAQGGPCIVHRIDATE